MERNVRRDLFPLDDPDNMARYNQLLQDYMAKAQELIKLPYQGPTRSEDRVNGIVYLVRPNPDMLKKAMPLVASELMDWFKNHRITKDFLARPASLGYYQFLLDRPDVQRLLRVIDEQPLDVTPTRTRRSSLPRPRPRAGAARDLHLLHPGRRRGGAGYEPCRARTSSATASVRSSAASWARPCSCR